MFSCISLYSMVNELLAVRARDVYAYGLAMMDVLFSKEEMADSLIEESKKSKKVLVSERMDKVWTEFPSNVLLNCFH